MTIGRAFIAGLGAVLALAFGGGSSALAKKQCGADGHWCSRQCGAWNNWCRPACGDWNAWCAGQSLPNVLSRMQPRSYFADPRWVGENYPFPKSDGDAAQRPTPKAQKRTKNEQAQR